MTLSSHKPAAKSNSHTEDQLAADMAELYDDPLGFVQYAFPWGEGELAGFDGPDDWQAEFLSDWGDDIKARGFNGVLPVDPIRFTTASGHGIGKSALVAFITLFIMSTRPFCKGVVTANTAPQLRTKTWAEIAKWSRRCVTGHWFEITTGVNMAMWHYQYKDSWRVDGQTCREENSEAFAGLHSASSTPFFIFDEASAIPNKIEEVAQGGLTDGEPMFFCFGNPTRNSGFFHDITFGKRRHRWRTRSIDSRDCKFPNKRLHEEWIQDNGIDSDFCRVRIRGLPPNQADVQFIPRNLVDDAVVREVKRELFQPIIVSVDVARFGEDQSIIRTRQGRDARSWPAKKYRGVDTMTLAAHILNHVNEVGREAVGAVFIDGGGVGGGVVDRCRQLGLSVVEVNFGGKSSNPRYLNKRAQMYGDLRDWLAGGAIEDDEALVMDLTVVEYGYTMDNKIKLESKDDLRDRVASPDDGDALALSFAEPVAPLDIRHPGGAPTHVSGDYDPIKRLENA